MAALCGAKPRCTLGGLTKNSYRIVHKIVLEIVHKIFPKILQKSVPKIVPESVSKIVPETVSKIVPEIVPEIVQKLLLGKWWQSAAQNPIAHWVD